MQPATQPEKALNHQPARLGWAVLAVSLLALMWEIGRGFTHTDRDAETFRVLVCDPSGAAVRARLVGPDGVVNTDDGGVADVPMTWSGEIVLVYSSSHPDRPLRSLLPKSPRGLVTVVVGPHRVS